MKQFTKIALLTAVVAMIVASCGKYEEGPSISLASKKGRLANVWKLDAQYYNNVEDVLTDDDKDDYIEFTKDGDVKMTYTQLGVSQTISGTWKFDDSKENVITTLNFVGYVSTDTAQILKLKSNELWVKIVDDSDVIERHYVTK